MEKAERSEVNKMGLRPTPEKGIIDRFRIKPSDNLENSIQLFVNQVCEKEGWEIPKVVIPSKEEWPHLQIILDSPAPPSTVIGKSSPQAGKIYLNPKYAVYRTNTLHELVHYNVTLEEIKEIIEDPIIKKHPKLAHFRIENLTEAKARRLARKYKKEWIEKTGLR